VTRHASAEEIRLTLARFGRQAPDDVDGYVVVLAKGGAMLCTLTNAADISTEIGLLAVAIADRADDVRKIEHGPQ
jgi:hypothetical protein